ncbi:unnamed protein product, partial [Phaeothamnion confervicola]
MAAVTSAAVLCVAFHPRCPGHFLAGADDGTIRLYRVAHARPLTTWILASIAGPPSAAAESKQQQGRRAWRGMSAVPPAVTALRWSPTRPAVFLALDAAGTVHAFDLVREETRALFSE